MRLVIRKILLVALAASFFLAPLHASSENASPDLGDFIMEHVGNSDSWHPFPGVVVPIKSLLPLSAGNIELSPTLHVFYLLLSALIIFISFVFIYKKSSKTAPKGLTNVMEVFVLFIRDEVIYENMGEKEGRRFAPLLLTFFFLILAMNVLGLIPAFGSATGNINITFAFASIVMLIMILGGIIYNGPIGFIKLFLPPGVPWILYIILFPIELLGIVIRPFALMVRLFANMFAGHVALLSLAGLIVMFGWFGTPAIALVLFIYILEVLVAVLQAFIFTLLSAMFIGQMIHPHH